MTDFTLIIRGEPQAQPRVKGRLAGPKFRPFVQIYTPSTANDWKAAVRREFEKLGPREPIAGPVEFEVEFYMPRPQRLCRKADPRGCIASTSKPDFDNLAKAVCDALTDAGAWHDDSQVWRSRISKVYHAIGAAPGARVRVRMTTAQEAVLFAEGGPP